MSLEMYNIPGLGIRNQTVSLFEKYVLVFESKTALKVIFEIFPTTEGVGFILMKENWGEVHVKHLKFIEQRPSGQAVSHQLL